MKESRAIIVNLVVIAGLAWCVIQWFASNLENQAHVVLFEDLKNKSSDHRSIVSMYRVCRMQQQKLKTTESVASHTCMQEARVWASKITVRVPFETIRNDIEGVEAFTFRKLKSEH